MHAGPAVASHINQQTSVPYCFDINLRVCLVNSVAALLRYVMTSQSNPILRSKRAFQCGFGCPYLYVHSTCEQAAASRISQQASGPYCFDINLRVCLVNTIAELSRYVMSSQNSPSLLLNMALRWFLMPLSVCT